MKARTDTRLGAVIAGAFLWAAAFAGQATAAGCGCTPSSPPPHGHGGGVNVFISGSAVANAAASARAAAAASSTVYVGGGGGGGSLAPPAAGFVQNLNVEGVRSQAAYEASRTLIRKVVIQAVCMDDRDTPHPASQVTPDRDIDNGYDGELFRCIAGTHMQAAIAEYDGRIAFDHAQTLACAKGEALYHLPAASGQGGGQVVCRPQKPARDCNERSLLRRFGPGVKILSLFTVEKYTAHREEAASSVSSMSLDGGVGGVAY